jgi:hypothetical protein
MNIPRELERLRTQVNGLLRRTPHYAEDSWTPTFTGFSADPAGGIYRSILVGKLCTLFVSMPNPGTSNDVAFRLTAPFTSANIASMTWGGVPWSITDNGAEQSEAGRVYIAANSDQIVIKTSLTGANFTASGGKAAGFTLTYETA